MEKPRIGVVIPTLNSATFLEWTLLSLRGQRGVDVEIIVADSGSTDGTLDLCARWGVPTVHEPPGSLYRAVNTGMRRLAHVPWVTYLNSDDVAYPDAYARLIARATEAGADLAYGDADFVDENGRFLYAYRAAPPALAARLARHGTLGFAQPAAIFRRELFDRLQGLRAAFRQIADLEFVQRAVASGATLAAAGPPSVCAFRMRRDQLSQTGRDVAAAEEAVLRQEGKLRAGGGLARAAWKARNWRELAVRYLRTNALRRY